MRRAVKGGWRSNASGRHEDANVSSGGTAPLKPNPGLSGPPANTPYYDGAYAPFGESYAEIGTMDRMFTGQTQDTVQGLYDFTFRRYSPTQGRWVSPDPAGLAAVDMTNPQTWNRYAYTGNNPTSNVDPLGLYIVDCAWEFCSPCGNCGSANGGGGGGDSDFTGLYNGSWNVPDCPFYQELCEPGGIVGVDLGIDLGGGGSSLGLGGVPGSSPTQTSTASPWNQACDFGVCNPIGNGIAGVDDTIEIGICVAQPEACVAILGAGLLYYYYLQHRTQTSSSPNTAVPCDPPAGTRCYEEHIGHPHNGWDPHYHVWTQNQNPMTGQCFWNRGGGTGGATELPPAGMQSCSSYASWPSN